MPPAKPGGADNQIHYVGDATRAHGGSGNNAQTPAGARPADEARSPKAAAHQSGKQIGDSFDAGISRRIASAASEQSDVYANSDGTFTRKVFEEPVNYRASDGSWQPIDRALQHGSDGRLKQTANALRATFAAGAADPQLVTMPLPDDQTLSFGLAGAANVAPVVTSNTALYAEVLAGVDVKLEALNNGTKESLILKDALAPTAFTFPLQLSSNLNAVYGDNGSVLIQDQTGQTVASIPAPYMFDSQFDPATGDFTRSDAVHYELVQQGSETLLRLVADPAWLADPQRVFPVTIDPSTFDTTGDTYVYYTDSADHSAESSLPIGTYDGGTHRARSLMSFAGFGSTYQGNTISAAYLVAHLTWTYDCTPRQFQVKTIAQSWHATTATWSSPSLGSVIGSSTPDPGPACTNTAADRSKGIWVSVQVSQQTIQGWVSGATPNYGLALVAPSETTSNQWKRFTSRNYANYAYQPYLQVTYAGNKAPQIDTMYPPYGYPSPTLTPTLIAGGHDPDFTPGKFTYDFGVKDKDNNDTVVADSGRITASSWTVPVGALQWGHAYTWTVKANDSLNDSTTVDYALSTPVPQPRLTSTLTQNGGLGFSPATGNYTTSATDAALSTNGPALSITRSYNSVDPRRSAAFGAAWSSIIDSNATRVTDAGGNTTAVIVTSASGQQTAFGVNADQTLSPPQGRYSTLRALADSNGAQETIIYAAAAGYRLIDKDGQAFYYTRNAGNGRFLLAKIVDVHGATETFAYNGAQLSTITSASGRVLHVTWSTPPGATAVHVESVYTDLADPEDPNSALTWGYGYEGDLLRSVCPPGTAIPNCVGYDYTSSATPYSLYPAVVRDIGPRSYLRLADPAGSTAAADTVGSGPGSVYGGVTFGGTGMLASGATSAAFNGTTGYVEQPTSAGLDSRQLSVSMWFKTSATSGVLLGQSTNRLTTTGTFSPYTPNLFISNGVLRGQFATIPKAGTTGNGTLVGSLLGAETGMCLDDYQALTTDHNPIQIHACNGTAAQQFSYGTNNRLSLTIGAVTKCLDVNGGGTANNTAVQYYTCNGTAAQNWIASPNGTFIGSGSGKCLTANGTASGSLLVIRDCASPPTGNQIWSPSVHAPIDTTVNVADNQWHHVVLTGDLSSGGNAQDQRIYLDGVDRGTIAGVTNATGQGYLQIGAGHSSAGWTGTAGASNAGSDVHFSGSIAEVAVFQHGLTPADIQSMRDAQTGSVRLLQQATTAAGRTLADVQYDRQSGAVTRVTDDKGGQWGIAAAVVEGSYLVHSSAVLGAAPTDYWRLADLSGDDAANELNGDIASYNNVTLGADRGPMDDPDTGTDDGLTSAAKFDGSTSYLNLPQSDVPSTGPVSIALWFKLAPTKSGVLFGYQANPITNTSSPGNWNPALYVGVDGRLRGGLYTAGGSTGSSVTSSNTVNDNNWHHVVLAAGTTGQRLYLDGNDIGGVGPAIATNSAYAYVGAGKWSGSWPSTSGTVGWFPGDIAEVAFYRGQQLTAGQVTSMFGAWSKSKGAALAKQYVITDPSGGTNTSHTFELSTGRKIAQTDSLGKRTTYGYDESGYLHTVTDPMGNVTTNWYDARGNIIQVQTCQDTRAEICSSTYSTYSPDATTKTFQPDANGRYSPCNDVLIAQRGQGSENNTDDNRYLTTYHCDPATGNRDIVTDPLGRTTTTTFTDGTTVAALDTGYAPAGLMNTQTAPDGGIRKIVYFHNGDIATVTDPSGKQTAFEYDTFGRVTRKTETTDTLGPQATTITYDPMSRVHSITGPPVVNRVTGATHTSSTVTTYDLDGNILTQTVSDTTTGGDAPRTMTLHYDNHGRKDWIEDATGKRTTYGYARNTVGEVRTTTDPLGVTMSAQFDTENHELTQTIEDWLGDPNNPSPARDLVVVSRAYDDAGRLASVTNAKPGTLVNGVTTEYTYYDNGLLNKTIVHDNDTTEKTFVTEENHYDETGALTQRLTNNGLTRTDYTVDAADRVTSTTLDPGDAPHLNRVTQTGYDVNDSPIWTAQRDRDGKLLSYDETMFDTMGRALSQTTYNSTGALAADPPTTPVGRWKLNETAGTTALDTAGNAPATATDVTWSTDATRGTVGSFDGTSSNIQVDQPVVETTRSYSVAAWVKLNTKATSQNVLTIAGAGGSALKLSYQQPTDRWTVDMTINVKADGTTDTVNVSGPAWQPQANVWTHLAVTVDTAAKTVKLYVNGVASTPTTTTKPFNQRGIAPIRIGADVTGSLWLNGSISDVQMYQKALDAAAVTSVKDATLPASTSGVIRTSAKVGTGGLTTSTTDALGNTTTYTYDEAGRLALTTSPVAYIENTGGDPVLAQSVTTTGYNTFGETTETKDPTGNRTVTEYDANGRVTKVTAPSYTPPGSSTPITPSTTTEYDDAGHLLTQTDPLGRITTYGHDQMGRVTSIATPGRTVGEVAVTRYAYDEVGNKISTTDPLGAVSVAEYDYLSRPTKVSTVVRQDGQTYATTSTYDNNGLVTEVKSPSGLTTTMTYDAAGEKLTTTDPGGHIYTTTYDDLGRPKTTLLPDGRGTATTYDMADRVIRQATSDTGAVERIVTTQTYDAAGRTLTATDALSHTTSFQYGATGLLVKEFQPVTSASCTAVPTPGDCIVTSFGYDAAGRRTRFTDGRGNSFLNTYNTWGLPESAVEPATAAYPNASDRTSTVAYDALGRAAVQTSPGGVTVTNAYDNAGNLVRQSGAGAEATTVDKAFGYDIGGRMMSFSGVSGTNTLTYDDRNLLKSVAGGASGDTSIEYDSDARMTKRIDAAGTTMYGYSPTTGLLTSTANSTAGISETYTYDVVNALKTITYNASTTVRTLDYDNLHHLSTDEVKTGTTSLGKITYGWDLNGNERTKTTTSFNGAAANIYDYDNANRLKSWTVGSTVTTYEYDKSGNRTKSGGNDFTYDARNRLMNSATTAYTYTARGTLHTTYNGTTETTLSDAFGQTVSQETAGQPTQTYTYDALGRSMKAGFAFTGITNDLAQANAVTYVRGAGGGLVAEKNGSAASVYAWTDLHSDVVGQFAASASALSGSTAYDPLGKVIATNSLTGNLGYQSEWTDAVTGRVNMLSRWYNPETGQFDNRDKASNNPAPASVNANRYAYGNDNPLVNTDPDGDRAFELDADDQIHYADSRGHIDMKHWHYTRHKPNPPSKIRYYPCIIWGPLAPPMCRDGVNKKLDNVSVCPHYSNTPNYYANCTVYQEYADGTVCINGHCTAKSECGAEDCRDVAQAIDDMAGLNTAGYGTAQDAKEFTEEVYDQAVQKAAKVEEDRRKAGEEEKAKVEAEKKAAECKGGIIGFIACPYIKAWDAAVDFAKAHPQIAGAIAGAAVGLLCGALIGWTGIGAVGCGALAGAVGSLVTGLAEGKTGWDLALQVGVGTLIGGVTGGMFSVGASFIAGAARGGIQFGQELAANELSAVLGSATRAAGNGLRDLAGSTIEGIEQRMFGAAPIGCPTHSFDPQTRVLTADGKTQKIADLSVGDKVIATDPQTGKTASKPITAVFAHNDTDLVDVTVHNPSTKTTAVLHATEHHPFWDDTDKQWVEAHDLIPGHTLLPAFPNVDAEPMTADAPAAVVESVTKLAGTNIMRDLTVANIHTYYVIAGSTSVLVHNCGGEGTIKWDPDMEHATITIKTANGRVLTTEQAIGGGWDGISNPNGFPTTGQIGADMGPNTISRTFQLPNADAARAAQINSLGADLGPYGRINNSCVTYCVGILREGGLDIPAGARGAVWLKRLLDRE